MNMMSFEDATSIVKVLHWGGRFLKKIHKEEIVRDVRCAASLSLFSRLHVNVIHKIRTLIIELELATPTLMAQGATPPQDKTRLSGLYRAAQDALTGCRDVMGDLLELPDRELHCCYKVLIRTKGKKDRVATIIRSQHATSHDDDDHLLQSRHYVGNNSTWASLTGESDGTTIWKEPFPCFCCNDLAKEDNFVCSREDWKRYYRSTLVFPIRFTVNDLDHVYHTIGFISFYSSRKDAFHGVPNIFDYMSTRANYETRLHASTVFQVGACMADILSGSLRPFYEPSTGRLRSAMEK